MVGMSEMSPRNWGMLVVRGVLAIIFAVLAFLWPGLTLEALVLLYGAYALVDGVFAVVAAFQSIGRQPRWWAMLIRGILGIVAGLVTFFWPGITALVLLTIIGVWAIFSGITEIVGAVELRREIDNEWLLALNGVLSILFGLIVIIFPGAGALSLIWLIASYALMIGILLIALGFRMRSAQQPIGRGRAGAI